MQVRSQTEAAADALLRLNPPDEPMAPIPAAAYNIAAALVAQEHGMPIGPPWSRIRLGGSRWVTVKASRLNTDIAVSIEPSTAADRLDIYARACGLTRRESEVLALLCQGRDTREIAKRMVISEHTASDHPRPSSPRPEPAPGSSSSPADWARSEGAPNAQPSQAQLAGPRSLRLGRAGPARRRGGKPRFVPSFERSIPVRRAVWQGVPCGQVAIRPLTQNNDGAVKQIRIREGRAHAALVFDDSGTAQGWCHYGSLEELPGIKHQREHGKDAPPRPDWRITCFSSTRSSAARESPAPRWKVHFTRSLSQRKVT